MSKQNALNMLMGADAPVATPSIVTGETKNVETQQPAAQPEVKEAAASLDSDRFAAIAKREAQLQKEREAAKKEREQIIKEREELAMVRQRASAFDEAWKKDKVQALRLLGATDEDIINIMAETQKTDEDDPVERARKIAQEEAQKIREEIANEKKQAEQAQNKRLIGQLKNNISQTIKAKSEKYEYCAFEGPEAELQAYEIIVQNLKLNKELLSVDQALEILDEYYEAKDKTMANLKKRQPKVEQQATPAKTDPEKTGTPTRNLTNRVTATGPALAQRRETPQEKRARLEQALRQGHL